MISEMCPYLISTEQPRCPPFSKSTKATWPPILGLTNRDQSLDKPFAVGGIIAMLLHMGNLGDFGMRAIIWLATQEDSSPHNI